MPGGHLVPDSRGKYLSLIQGHPDTGLCPLVQGMQATAVTKNIMTWVCGVWLKEKKRFFFVDLKKKIHYIFFLFVSGFYWIAKNAWDDWVFEFQNLQDDHILF